MLLSSPSKVRVTCCEGVASVKGTRSSEMDNSSAGSGVMIEGGGRVGKLRTTKLE